MNLLSIKLNGDEYQICEPIPEKIEYLNVVCGPFPLQVHPSEIPLIKQWLNKVIDNFVGTHATYNGILVEKASLTRFKL